jgi:AraC-like DNA-binding protein
MDRIPESQHLRIWTTIMSNLESPGFPIRFARRMAIDDYEVLGLACKTVEQLGDAIDCLMRFLALWTDTYRCRLEAEGERSRLVFQRAASPAGSSVGARAANESGVAEIAKAMRDITGNPIESLRAHFRHPEPEDCSEHEEFFGERPEFGADIDGLSFDSSVLELGVLHADEGLSRYLSSQLESMMAKLEPTLLERTRIAISDALPVGPPRIDQIAQRLAMSPRSLQRKLRDEGASFTNVIDEVRQELAESLLSEPSRSVAETCYLLGFSEPRAFHRAFKRWTGQTPRAWRMNRAG